jgi:hypothetical protein
MKSVQVITVSKHKCSLVTPGPDAIVLEGDFKGIVEGLQNVVMNLSNEIELSDKDEMYKVTIQIKHLI